MVSRAADIRDSLLIAVALVLGAFLSPQLPYVGLPLAGAALAWLTYRWGLKWGLGAAVLASPLAATSGLEQVWFALPALLVAGPAAAVMLRRWSPQRVVAVVTMAIVAATVLPSAAHAVATGGNIVSTVVADYRVLAGLIIRSVIVAGGAQPPLTQAAMRTAITPMLPTVLVVYPALLAGLLDVIAVTWAARRCQTPVRTFPPLAKFDVSPHWVWLAIGGLGLLALASFTGQTSSWMEVVGINALLIVRPIVFAQGLGVFSAIYERAHFGKIARTIGYALLVGMEVLFPSVSVLGLTDLFANFRKLDRPGALPRGENVQIGG